MCVGRDEARPKHSQYNGLVEGRLKEASIDCTPLLSAATRRTAGLSGKREGQEEACSAKLRAECQNSSVVIDPNAGWG